MNETFQGKKPNPLDTPLEYPSLSRATLFATGCAVIILEVALTRVFSLVLWYHLTYLVISLALLGYGAAGTYLATRSSFLACNYPRTIARCCSLFSLLTVVAVAAAAQLTSDAELLFQGQYVEMVRLTLTHLTLAAPFFFAGTAIGFVLMRNRQHTSQLYSADLCGAGLGSFLSVLLINWLGAITAIFLAASLPAMVALATAWKDRAARKITYAGLVLFLIGGSIVSVSHQVIPLRITPGKNLALRQSEILFTGWNIISRIDVIKPAVERADLGGRISSAYQGPLPQILPIFQDGTAPTALVRVEGRVADYPLLDYYLQGAPYAIRRRPQSVLVIGIGGGIDALIAEHAGARRIVGVDINPITIDLLRRRYRDFASSLFEGANLELVVSEGRHYLTKSAEKFDVVQLSGVDTFAALTAGALVLSENYLYTVEAIMDLMRHLNDEGVLSYSRGLFTPPRETLKLVVTESDALRKMGIRDVDRHFFIVAGGAGPERWADTMVKKTPFAREELLALGAWARHRQFEVIYDPSEPRPNPFNTYLRSSEKDQKEFVRSYRYHVAPSRDDHPFFFEYYRWQNVLHLLAPRRDGDSSPVQMPEGLLSLILTFGELVLFSLVFVFVPLRNTQSCGPLRRRTLPWFVAFVGLGFGFIAIEMVLIQKLSVFLGGPAYSMAVTLFALLVFSGLGSRLSQRLSRSNFAAIAGMIVWLLAVEVLELCFLNLAVPALLVLPHGWRCAVAIAAIGPLGLLMGMPFPTLLAKTGEASPALVPWAWGVNACATVVGSVLATMISLELGFNITWLLAMSMYLVVLTVVAIHLSEKQIRPALPKIPSHPKGAAL